ncbi:putative SOS response-associated peptidase YoaM [Lentibacillus sp. JNUCC-1]|uniref:SOS response-associated peptidase n=1 Tax=Lentibacillus sp. JNUCC-1 TaxID=2654513 RepID=UPI0012E78308|nr:SOS response-associated peptidase [Lentibacillus sp. JNUCC-1]MUV38670.1 putative SOS response-associated peptidase YoaM [Lentibacillus sp. JNUCC-1]
MCGRYTLLAEERDIQETFGLSDGISEYEPSYNVAPGQNVLSIIHDGKEKRGGYMRWGLVPSWAKDPKIGYKMINARSESAHEKPSFKSLMARKRCLIIADSFYEWQASQDGKQPKRIQTEDGSLFAFAGLWDKWQQGDEVLFTCTILTRDANTFMQDIHHRMPIILPKGKEADWIAPTVYRPEEAQAFLTSLTSVPLKAHNVSTYVNSAKHNDPECITPLTSN